MKVHILGICGTFMGGIAAIARAKGYQVSGSDQNIYPPMSDQLESMGITLSGGYDDVLTDDVDQYIVGNVMRRGMPIIESLLREKQSYVSGPQWLGEQVLRHRQVFAVSGTHGKTTTSSMLAWILQDNGLAPGFLIGGVSPHFELSARLGEGQPFVIEADEYDSAFFDKRSKFLHYFSNVLVMNNLEFDHADIFDDLKAIQKQFHHAVRTVPDDGLIIYNADDENVKDVLKMGCWTPSWSFGSTSDADYRICSDTQGNNFQLMCHGNVCAEVIWGISGQHNQYNATAAMLAAQRAGISLSESALSLSRFKNVKRRQELVGEVAGIQVYDDFAHHPTAIAATLKAFRQAHPDKRLVIILEPRSNSMRAGVHAHALPAALAAADLVHIVANDNVKWPEPVVSAFAEQSVQMNSSVTELLQKLNQQLQSDDVVVFMSNGGFDQAPTRLLEQLHD
ncbi:UDP-N-acetylmuramate:L-alanyl-gamma-D-glutamyl-meso-diaminopimelate ligase [Marinicella sp. W31]|uniref:UDP-N-acetylmuramate:L-alanyl-gamma-D-glutamyl- meso-diaminopimelate ligase n=1 Tax=Marinicella sp. W31 TaxID=3023713 RepID=UPI0037573F77